jgi:hypothetical protein
MRNEKRRYTRNEQVGNLDATLTTLYGKGKEERDTFSFSLLRKMGLSVIEEYGEKDGKARQKIHFPMYFREIRG